MRAVSYTRTTTCVPCVEVPADIIKIQNEHIRAYAKENGFKISKTYSDRKADGNERSAFDQMLQDGMRRDFDLVITDSLRRCGINIWEAQEVLMQTFFPAGIHFVIVEDGFSSIGKTTKEVEAYFSEERGKYNIEKLKHRINTRNKKGLLTWNDAKYGYRLTEDYKLEIDEETAPVVKRIFELCAGGMLCRDVAKLLSAEKIPSPLSKRGTKVEIKDPYKWTREGVSRIVRKTVYAGHWTKIVQGEEMNFTTDPIVSEELFQAAQAATNAITYETKDNRSKKHRYNKVAVDVEHGFSLRYRKNKEGYEYFNYITAELAAACEVKQLPFADVDASVLMALSEGKGLASLILERIRSDGEAVKTIRIAELDEKVKNASLSLAKSEQQKMDMYQKLNSGKISKEVYEQALLDAKNVLEEVEAVFKQEVKGRKRIEQAFSENNPWVMLFLNYEMTEIVDHDLIGTYVESVEINNLQVSRVILKEAQWLMMLPEEWRQGYGEKK